jgi:hypothetical protein
VFVTNHVLSGVLIGRALEGRPTAAFITGVASHLVLDAMPHWGCDMREQGAPERFLRIAKRDGLLGLATMTAATLAVDRRSRGATLAAMAGAVLLDLDKPSLHFFGTNPFPAVVKWIHKKVQNESFEGMPNEISYGICFAAANAVVLSGQRHRLRSSMARFRPAATR